MAGCASWLVRPYHHDWCGQHKVRRLPSCVSPMSESDTGFSSSALQISGERGSLSDLPAWLGDASCQKFVSHAPNPQSFESSCRLRPRRPRIRSHYFMRRNRKQKNVNWQCIFTLRRKCIHPLAPDLTAISDPFLPGLTIAVGYWFSRFTDATTGLGPTSNY
jgi:hypothetical protein